MANGELIQSEVAVASVSTPASGKTSLFPNAYGRYTAKTDDGATNYLTAPMVNVLDFGAVGNGITDSTAAIQAAINSLVVGSGGTVYLPWTPSAYQVTGLTIGKGIRLIGDGIHGTVIRCIGSNQTAITTNSAAGGGQEIAYLQIIPNDVTNKAIWVKGTDHAYIHDCRFYGAVDAHVVLDQNNVGGAYTHRILNCQFDNLVTAASVGLRITNTQGTPSGAVVNTVVALNHFFGDAPIVYVNFAGGTPGADEIVENQFTARTNGVGTAISLSANSMACRITQNYFEQFANAITIASGSGNPTPHVIAWNHYDTCTVRLNNSNSPATVGVNSATTDVQALLANQAATAATTVLVGATWTSQSSILSVGSQIRCRFKFVTVKTTSPPTLTFQMKVAGTSQAAVVVTQISSVTAGSGWLEGVVTIRTVGATGTAVATIVGGYSQGLTSGVDTSFGLVNTATFVIDTTATKLFELVGFMTTGVVSNTLTIAEGSVEVVRV
jgi:hypothetical protein